MKKTILIISCLFQLVLLSSCGQKSGALPETFIGLLNRYQNDSLKRITTDSFQLVEPYISHTYNKAGFINSFVAFSKVINGKFNIIKKLPGADPAVFETEDASDYLTLLKVKPPLWKLSVIVKAGKVDKLISDTLPGYQAYLEDFTAKHNLFIKWLSTAHPTETEIFLFNNSTGLLTARLKEYMAL